MIKKRPGFGQKSRIGAFSEKVSIEAINNSSNYFALQYGSTGVGPVNADEFRDYAKQLHAAGNGPFKRPDILVFRKKDQGKVEATVRRLGGVNTLPFVPEENLGDILKMAIYAVECEASTWVAEDMPGFKKPNSESKSMKFPTVILKDEDRVRLLDWQTQHRVPVGIWHLFPPSVETGRGQGHGYALVFDEAERLIANGTVKMTPKSRNFPKDSFQFKPRYCVDLGQVIDAKVNAVVEESVNGHLMPFLVVEGGLLLLNKEVLDEWTAS